MNPTICFAIKSQRVIRISYDGGLRTVEPYCHGVSIAGFDLLRAYQTSGYSASRQSIEWKLIYVNQIQSLALTEVLFSGRRRGYNPNDSAMARTYCCIPYSPQLHSPVGYVV